jgi:hypothetical protein
MTCIIMQWNLYRTYYKQYLRHFRCPDGAVGIATGYGVGQPRLRSSSPGRVKNSLLHDLQTGSGTKPASYPISTGGFFLGENAAGAWSLHTSN